MTSLARKIPLLAMVLFFSVAALASVLKGGGLATAFSRGIVAGAVAWVLTALLAYIVFAEKLPEANTPPGLEEMEEKFKTKVSK